MKVKITQRVASSAQARNVDYHIMDAEIRGFGIRIRPTGQKSFFLRYRRPRGLVRHTIGQYPEVTCENARREAERLRAIIAIGRDPGEEKIKVREAEAEEKRSRLTVADLCSRYWEAGTAHKKASTLAIDRGRIDRHILPLIGKKLATSLTQSEVRAFQSDVAAGKTATMIRTKPRGLAIVKGGRAGSNRVIGLLGAIFQFGIEAKLVTVNPVRGVKLFASNTRERFLSERELASLGEALSALEGPTPDIVRLLLLTGCRRGEITNLRWREVDFEHNILRLADSKSGKRELRIRPAAMQILSSRRMAASKDGIYVFPGRDPSKPFVGLPRIWRTLTKNAGLSDVRIHDLRHSFASVSVANGNSLVLTAALLGHKSTRATARYAHLSDEPIDKAASVVVDKIAKALDAGLRKSTG